MRNPIVRAVCTPPSRMRSHPTLPFLRCGLRWPRAIRRCIRSHGSLRCWSRSWPKGVTDLLRQQVQEPEEERQLRRSIPVLTPIEDAVSVAVRHQYEENPFPRWVKCEPPGRPWTIDQFLRSRFPAALFRNLGKANVDILIAGCGTGQQAIEIAQRHPQARLLAVDLSLSSLAYASRQTRARS